MKNLYIVAGVIIVARILYEMISWIFFAVAKSKANASFGLLGNDSIVDSNKLFVKEFALMPSCSYVNNIDVAKAFDLISAGEHGKIKSLYQSLYYDWTEGKQCSTKTVLLLEKRMVVELGSGYAEVYYASDEFEKAAALVNAFVTFRLGAKAEPNEINIISMSKHGLELKPLEINATELDIEKFYNDDFEKVDRLIKERLLKENDKGIILLHGLPGTGKTTYLRHIVGCLHKKVLFVSPSVASDLMNPEFIDLLIKNPNSVLVIEDAENIIMDRKYSSKSSVSNLLNLSDGLLSDCLNVQVICTFNNAIEMVDSALMLKGRLIAKYEFGKLEVEKAQLLSNHLGFDTKVNKPMTLAEIANQHEMLFETKQVQVLGFRRDAVFEN
jgi:hypothetical protein